ncbi:MAG TPA: ImmA/IrrE family metallo-endopeptidase [Gammaproteobacteria bacterium]|nr:ImmA/IrrE family metallo-endopeptidase [Gammaproteobacteria bacterium]
MNHLKIIKNDAEHQAALKALVRLLEADPAPGTPQADELDVLSLLLEQYEQANYPLELPDPLEAIRFRMEQQGLTQKDLIPYIGSASKVSEVLNGKRPLSITMIRRLHQGLGIPAEVLIREPGAELPADCDEDWQRFPIAEMLKQGYFKGFSGSPAQAKTKARQLVGKLFRRAGVSPDTLVFCRTTAHRRASKQMNLHALAAWQARVLEKAAASGSLPPYQPGSVTLETLRDLVRLSWSEQGPALVPEFLARHGIVFVVEKHLQNTYLDGAAMVDAQGRPVVALTLRHDRIDNFWFTLLHELAHVALHLNDEQTSFFDDLSPGAKVDKIEEEADRLASEALIPDAVWRNATARKSRDRNDVIALARQLNIHPAIIAGRIRHEAADYTLLTKGFNNNKRVRKQFPDFAA